MKLCVLIRPHIPANQVVFSDLLNLERRTARNRTNILERRARLLLQGAGMRLAAKVKILLTIAGFLDVTKVIEYRPPLTHFSFWRQPSVPQCKSSFDLKKQNTSYQL